MLSEEGDEEKFDHLYKNPTGAKQCRKGGCPSEQPLSGVVALATMKDTQQGGVS